MSWRRKYKALKGKKMPKDFWNYWVNPITGLPPVEPKEHAETEN